LGHDVYCRTAVCIRLKTAQHPNFPDSASTKTARRVLSFRSPSAANPLGSCRRYFRRHSSRSSAACRPLASNPSPHTWSRRSGKSTQSASSPPHCRLLGCYFRNRRNPGLRLDPDPPAPVGIGSCPCCYSRCTPDRCHTAHPHRSSPSHSIPENRTLFPSTGRQDSHSPIPTTASPSRPTTTDSSPNPIPTQNQSRNPSIRIHDRIRILG